MLPRISLCGVLAAVLLAVAGVGQRDQLARLPQDADVGSIELPGVPRGFEPFPLPGEGPVHGVAHVAQQIWLARGERLLALKGLDGSLRKGVSIPVGLLGLAGDERHGYALLRRKILVLDRVGMMAMRELPLPGDARAAPLAIGSLGSELFVLWYDRITAINKRSGSVRQLRGASRYVEWLSGNGKALIGGNVAGFGAMDISQPFQNVDDRLRVNVPLHLMPNARNRQSFGECIGDRVLLVRQAPGDKGPIVSAGFAAIGAQWQLEKLILKIHGPQAGMRYQIGPKPLGTKKALLRELKRIAAHPASQVPGPDGKAVLMPVVIRTDPAVKVADLLATYDCASEAGFREIFCLDARRHPPWNLPVAGPPPPPPPFRAPVKKKQVR